jgi:hypothetical protein
MAKIAKCGNSIVIIDRGHWTNESALSCRFPVLEFTRPGLSSDTRECAHRAPARCDPDKEVVA